MQPVTSQLSEVLEHVLQSKLIDVHTSFVGKITSYDAAKQTASIEPMMKKPIIAMDLNTDDDIEESIPMLDDVPVVFSRGGSSYIHIPLVVGDYVLVVCTMTDISNWRTDGNIDSENQTPRMHDINSCFAIPGAFHDQSKLLNIPDTENIVIANKDMVVDIKSNVVEVGGASDAAALASKVDELLSAFNTFISVYNTHTHTVGSATSATPVSTGSTSTIDFTSTKLKIGG